MSTENFDTSALEIFSGQLQQHGATINEIGSTLKRHIDTYLLTNNHSDAQTLQTFHDDLHANVLKPLEEFIGQNLSGNVKSVADLVNEQFSSLKIGG